MQTFSIRHHSPLSSSSARQLRIPTYDAYEVGLSVCCDVCARLWKDVLIKRDE